MGALKKSTLIQVTSEGLYCPAGDFYIDPWRPVARACLTHAHSDHAREGSRAYFATEVGSEIIRHRLGPSIHLTTYPYGTRFTLGEVTVSFHPAGHILGSSQIRLQYEGQVWVISGDYKRDPDPTCAPFEVVPCDVFITEATFGLPIYRWENAENVGQEIFDWWMKNRKQNRTSLLGCYSLGKAQRVLGLLSQFTNEKVYTHGATEHIVGAYRRSGVPLLTTEKVGEGDKKNYAGELVLAPPGALASLWARRFKRADHGFASGWMRIRGSRRRRGYDRGFVLSDHADWPSLLRTVDETGAKRIYVTHGSQDNLSRYLTERGNTAMPLTTLYEGEVEE